MRVLPWVCAGAGLVLIVGTLYRGRIRALADRLPDGARTYALAGGGLLILAGLAVALLVNRRPRNFGSWALASGWGTTVIGLAGTPSSDARAARPRPSSHGAHSIWYDRRVPPPTDALVPSKSAMPG